MKFIDFKKIEEEAKAELDRFFDYRKEQAKNHVLEHLFIRFNSNDRDSVVKELLEVIKSLQNDETPTRLQTATALVKDGYFLSDLDEINHYMVEEMLYSPAPEMLHNEYSVHYYRWIADAIIELIKWY